MARVSREVLGSWVLGGCLLGGLCYMVICVVPCEAGHLPCGVGVRVPCVVGVPCVAGVERMPDFHQTLLCEDVQPHAQIGRQEMSTSKSEQ